MKRFAVVLLSVLLVLLPGCTKPVTESGVQSTESGTAESTAEALSSTESGARILPKRQSILRRRYPPA